MEGEGAGSSVFSATDVTGLPAVSAFGLAQLVEELLAASEDPTAEDLSGASFELPADLTTSVAEEVSSTVTVHFLCLNVPGFPRASLSGRRDDSN
jgi:hypothetical protein